MGKKRRLNRGERARLIPEFQHDLYPPFESAEEEEAFWQMRLAALGRARYADLSVEFAFASEEDAELHGLVLSRYSDGQRDRLGLWTGER